jgi:hypothetical protein
LSSTGNIQLAALTQQAAKMGGQVGNIEWRHGGAGIWELRVAIRRAGSGTIFGQLRFLYNGGASRKLVPDPFPCSPYKLTEN